MVMQRGLSSAYQNALSVLALSSRFDGRGGS